MLRFILNTLLLRDLIQSRYFKVVAAIFFTGLLLVGLIYAYVFVSAALERMSHAHSHHTR